ncbi:MAG: MOSC domain-containing protein [Nocardioidaceae bacterium]
MAGTIEVTKSGLVGDEQADLRFHGGADKAICFYPREHYLHWQAVHELNMPKGGFGENVTIQGLPETSAHVGDVWAFGSAVVQISASRRPCWKLGARWGMPMLPEHVQRSGLTGYYARVIEQGSVSVGQAMSLVQRPHGAVTVFELNRIMNINKGDLSGVERLLAAPGIPAPWVRKLERRLNGIPESDTNRLFGTRSSHG